MIDPSYYYPIEYIFNIASILRRGNVLSRRSLKAAIDRRILRSLKFGSSSDRKGLRRFSFWLRLMEAACLLDEHLQGTPTVFVSEWLKWSFVQQMSHLVKAWIEMPSSNKSRGLRKTIILKLIAGEQLSSSQEKEAGSLFYLSVYSAGQLTPLGEAVLRHAFDTACIYSTWDIQGGELIVPFPPKWDLLWDLEKYLDPLRPGVYSLSKASLHSASQRGAIARTPSLVDILRSGLGKAPPANIVTLLEFQPGIQVFAGYILEFQDTEEIKRLRRTRMRSDLDRILSPRHIYLDVLSGQALIRRLYTQKLISEHNFHEMNSYEFPKKPGISLTGADRAYLLYILLLKQNSNRDEPAPPGLLGRLVEGVNPELLAAASRKASDSWQSDGALAVDTEANNISDDSVDHLLEHLQAAIDHQDSVDILYKSTRLHAAESRRISPLLIEKRASRHYLVAYCHHRKANRTFRLDRLKLV